MLLPDFGEQSKGCCLFLHEVFVHKGRNSLPRGIGAQERKLVCYEGMIYYMVRLRSIRCVWNNE